MKKLYQMHAQFCMRHLTMSSNRMKLTVAIGGAGDSFESRAAKICIHSRPSILFSSKTETATTVARPEMKTQQATRGSLRGPPL